MTRAAVVGFPRNDKKLPGIGKLLFETPTGFAIFSFLLEYLHEDIEHIWHYFVGDYWHYYFLWLHDFQPFEDKSNAINLTTGQIDGALTGLLWDYCLPEEVIVVGRPEYKSIIEDKLRRTCVYNEKVVEVMWGLQNLMHILIPQEQSEFTKADRLPICKGLDMVLSRHGINNVKPEMLNERILEMALKVYHADLREKDHSTFLHRILDKDLKAISGFDAKDWDILKLATALKSMSDPDGTCVAECLNLFSHEELALIFRDAPQYQELIDRATIVKIYNDIVIIRAYLVKLLLKLRRLVKKAETALKTEDVLEKAATNGVDSMQQVDQTCLTVDLVEVPSQSSIDEEQQHITDLADSTLPSQKTNEPGTSLEGTNQENEAEKASLGEQRNTILDVVRNDLEEAAEEISGNVPLIEEVIATNKDTPAVGTTQDVAQHANTQAQEIDAEQIINALVNNRGMHTNNGEGGEWAEATDLSRGMHTNNGEGEQADEDITGGGGEQAEVTDLSKSSERTFTEEKEIVADEDITGEGGKQAEVTDLSKSLGRTCTENKEIVADEDITGLADLSLSLARTSTDKKEILSDDDLDIIGPADLSMRPRRTSTSLGSQLYLEWSSQKSGSSSLHAEQESVQNNDGGGEPDEGTSLLSLLSMDLPEQTRTRSRFEIIYQDMVRRIESKAETSRSGPLAQPSRHQPWGGDAEPVRSSDPLPVYWPRSSDAPLAAGSKDKKASEASGSGHPSASASAHYGHPPASGSGHPRASASAQYGHPPASGSGHPRASAGHSRHPRASASGHPRASAGHSGHPLAAESKDKKTSTKDAPLAAESKAKKTSTKDAPLAAESKAKKTAAESKAKKTSTKDAPFAAESKAKKTSTKDAASPVKVVLPETSSADPEAVRPDPGPVRPGLLGCFRA